MFYGLLYLISTQIFRKSPRRVPGKADLKCGLEFGDSRGVLRILRKPRTVSRWARPCLNAGRISKNEGVIFVRSW